MSASNSAVPDPTHIGKFEIVDKLGAGAFGTVYKAKDPELGRLVAVKTIRLEGLAASQASLDDLVARFKREAKVAAGLKHPNIVTIHEIGSLPGNSYLVMEFVDGVGLDRVIKGSGKMSVERAAAIGMQVADALAYAQKHNVVHRDIKPANIMIEPGDHVKVTDFGIAKVTDSVDHLTATGSLLGTPSYMSPEQARGGTVDGRSDLFSVGCILYEMVSGQRAFRGESITALLFKIITEEPPSLRELDPTVSDEMLRIIAKALSKTPETRYQSGRELADDLLAITRPGFVPTLRAREMPTLPPDAPPADVPTLRSPTTLQSPPTIASAATAASGPGLAPTIVTPTAGGAPPPLPTVPPIAQAPPRPAAPPPPRAARPQPQQERRKGGGTGMVVGIGIVGVLLVLLLAVGGYFMLQRGSEAPPTQTATEATPQPTAAPSASPESRSSSPAEAPASVVATPVPATTLAPSRSASLRPEPGPVATPPRPAGAAGPGPARSAAADPPPADAAPAGDDSRTSTTCRPTSPTGVPRATRSRRSTAPAAAARTPPAATPSVPRCHEV